MVTAKTKTRKPAPAAATTKTRGRAKAAAPAKPKAATGKSGGASPAKPKRLTAVKTTARKIAEQPVVTDAVAAALLAAAAALREPPKGQRAAGSGSAGTFVEALRGIALDVARKTLDALDEGRAGGGKTGGKGGARKR